MPEKIVDTKINVSTTEAQKEIARLTKQLEKLDAQIEKKRQPKAGLYDFVADLEEQARKLDPKSGAFKELAEKIDTAWADLFDFEEGAGITGLLDDRDALTGAIAYLESSSAEVAQNTQQAKENTSELGENAKKSTSTFDRIANRLSRLVLNALIFNQIAKAMRSVVGYFSQALAGNEAWNKAVSELKGAFATLAQPLVNAVLPVLLTILRVITAIISHIASVLSLIFGTTLGDSAKQAQKIGSGMATGAKNAEKMKKSLAGFDEINTLNTKEESSGGGGGGAGGGATFDFAKGIEEDILKIEAIALGAMLALGLLLLFFGGPAQIPLALGLIATGALGLVGLVRSEDITPGLRQKILEITAIASASMLALGVVMLALGVKPMLALGMIVAGMAGLVAVAHEAGFLDKIEKRFEELGEFIQKAWKTTVKIVKGIWVGFSTAFILVIDGIKEAWQRAGEFIRQAWEVVVKIIQGLWVGFKTAFTITINGIKTTATNAWNGIKSITSTVFGGIKTIVTNVWNVIKTGASDVGNKVKTFIGDKVDGVKTSFTNVKQAVQDFKDRALVVFEAVKKAMSGDFAGAVQTLKDGFKEAGDKVGGISSKTDILKDKLNDTFGKKYTLDVEENLNVAKVTGAYVSTKGVGNKMIIPMASGGVIPPNKEFLTLLGDNKTETEVVSPLSTMKQAMVEALAEGGYSGGNNQTIQVNVDGKKLFDIIVNQNNNTVKRTGATPLLV